MGAFVGKVVEKVIRRTAAWPTAGSRSCRRPTSPMAERLRGYAAEAGPRPGVDRHRVRHRRAARRRPAKWVERAEAYRALGATHLRVMTAGGGFDDPAEHLAAALRWLATSRRRLRRHVGVRDPGRAVGDGDVSRVRPAASLAQPRHHAGASNADGDHAEPAAVALGRERRC